MFMLSFTDSAIVLSMFMLSFIFMIVHVCGLFEWKQISTGFLSLVYIHLYMFGDPVTGIKKGGLGSH
jgi:hypothetical protein